MSDCIISFLKAYFHLCNLWFENVLQKPSSPEKDDDAATVPVSNIDEEKEDKEEKNDIFDDGLLNDRLFNLCNHIISESAWSYSLKW